MAWMWRADQMSDDHTRWPGILARIADLCGSDAAEQIARAMGGRRCYLPIHPSSQHPVARVLGHKAALLIAQHCGPGQVDIPRAARWLHSIDVRLLYDQGLSQRDVATRLQLTERHVGRLLDGYRRPQQQPPEPPAPKPRPRKVVPGQLDMFD